MHLSTHSNGRCGELRLRLKRNRRMECVNVGCMFIRYFLFLGKAKVPVPNEYKLPNRMELIHFSLLLPNSTSTSFVRTWWHNVGVCVVNYNVVAVFASAVHWTLKLLFYSSTAYFETLHSKGYRWLMSHSQDVIIY